jgi:hypothetical protein
VLVVDQLGYPGGMMTAGGVLNVMGFGVDGRQVVGGVADEFVRRLDAMGAARFRKGHECVSDKDPIGDRPLDRYVHVEPEPARVVANRMIEESGAERLLYTRLIGAQAADGIVAAAAVDNIEGPGLVRARAFVDATGDAELVSRAGGAVRDFPIEESMTKSLLLRLGGVRGWDRAELTKRYRALYETGKAPFPSQDRFMGMAMINPGEVSLNFTLAVGDALSAGELTRMDAELREQALTTLGWFREHMPGFEDAFLMEAAPRIGVRAGRAIVGRRTLTVEDIENGNPVSDPVAVLRRRFGGHGIRRFADGAHGGDAGAQGLPYGTLLPADLRNVVAGGRSISAEPFAITAVRLMATCMATGEAAGVAAALAAREGREIAQVPYAELREALLLQGAILE